MEGCNLLHWRTSQNEHIHAGSVKVAAISESRPRWPASYRRLQDHSWFRAADGGNYIIYSCICLHNMNGMAALQQKQPKFYECLVFDGHTILGYQSSSLNETAVQRE